MMLVLVNGEMQSQVSVLDRGLQYGDGVFETVLFKSNQPVLMTFHLQRLALGAQRLSIPMPKNFDAQLERAIALRKEQVASGDSDSFICKIILTRGTGGRGYRPVELSSPTLIISFHGVPEYPITFKSQGIETKICSHRLSENPVTARIKHLNRLDQIIASAELGELPEGVMCDQKGNVVEGTRSNILVFSESKIYTPLLNNSGVDGCLRRFLIEKSEIGALGVEIIESIIPLDKLRQADGIAYINSVFGLWPVVNIADRTFTITPESKLISRYLYQELGM